MSLFYPTTVFYCVRGWFYDHLISFFCLSSSFFPSKTNSHLGFLMSCCVVCQYFHRWKEDYRFLSNLRTINCLHSLEKFCHNWWYAWAPGGLVLPPYQSVNDNFCWCLIYLVAIWKNVPSAFLNTVYVSSKIEVKFDLQNCCWRGRTVKSVSYWQCQQFLHWWYSSALSSTAATVLLWEQTSEQKFLCTFQSPAFDNGCEYIWELSAIDCATAADKKSGVEVEFSFDYYRLPASQGQEETQREGTFKATFQFGSTKVWMSPLSTCFTSSRHFLCKFLLKCMIYSILDISSILSRKKILCLKKFEDAVCNLHAVQLLKSTYYRLFVWTSWKKTPALR